MIETCSVQGCDRVNHLRRGVCAGHRRRLKDDGDYGIGRPLRVYSNYKQTTDQEYVIDHVVIDGNDCWIWQGSATSAGYGATRRGNAHRFSWRAFEGEIPSGLWVLHTCDVKLCCNTTHLYLGTRKDNLRDAVERGLLDVRPETRTRVLG